MLARRGVAVANLGPATPAGSVVQAAAATHPSAVVVISHTPAAAAQPVDAVRAVAQAGYPV